MSAHFLWEVGHSPKCTNYVWQILYMRAVTHHEHVCDSPANPYEFNSKGLAEALQTWSVVCHWLSCIKFRTQLVFRTNAGHVKQGLRCKHCRVNIHQSCGAKVSRLTSFYMVTHRQSLKYRSVDIYKPNLRLINSPTAMWYSIYQVSVCQPKKKKRLLRRGKSFDAKKASRPSGSQNDKWVLPRKVYWTVWCISYI